MKRTLGILGALALLTSPTLAQGSDACASAQGISGPGPFNFDNTNATKDGLPDVLCDFSGNQDIEDDVWFAWIAVTSGLYTVETCGQTTVDTKMAIYTGGCAGTVIACNDDACSTQSSASFLGSAGTTYWIRLGSFSAGSGGTGTFTITEELPVTNPANGHQYLRVPSAGIGWTEAQTAATGTSVGGVSGHLATLTDQVENDFVFALGDVANYWVGGFQDLNDPGYSEPGGGWKWVTGEPWSFTQWLPGEPNNSGAFASEDFLELLSAPSFADTWNDVHPMEHPRGYIIEYSTGATTYCTAKVNSLGCTPSIGTAGQASAAGTGTFDITASLVINNKPGILFYGFGTAAVPFQGGVLCVQPPVQRTAVQLSGGNPPPNDCSGVFNFDFNGYMGSGADPNLIPGATPSAQFWYRDPGSPSTTGLSDAVTFFVGV